MSVTTHVALFNYQRNKVLLVHDLGGKEPTNKKFKTPKPERWELPTGTVHNGETPYEAAKRELREESNILSEETPLIISRLPIFTSKRVNEVEEGGPEEREIHLDTYFVAALKNPDQKLPDVPFPIIDPVKHIIEGYWASFDELPTHKELCEYCRIFDQAKSEQRTIERIPNSPLFIVGEQAVFPLSPFHRRFIFESGLRYSPEELDAEIPGIIKDAIESGFHLPFVPSL